MREHINRTVLVQITSAIILVVFAIVLLGLRHGWWKKTTNNSAPVAQHQEQTQSLSSNATATVPRVGNQQSSPTRKPSGPAIPKAHRPSEQKPGGKKPIHANIEPQRHVTEEQKSGLADLADSIPKPFTVVVGSGDTREQESYATEIEHVFSRHVNSRQQVWVDYHAGGMFLAVKSRDDAAYPYSVQLAKGMNEIGFPVVGIVQNEKIHSGEIHILVGVP